MILEFCAVCGCRAQIGHHRIDDRAPQRDERNLITLCGPCLGKLHEANLRRNISAGIALAQRRGKAVGGWTAGSERAKNEADQMADRMRPVMAEFVDLSAHATALELNRRKVATPTGKRWHAVTILRLRKRIEARPARPRLKR